MTSVAEKTIHKYLPNLRVKGKGITLKNLPAFFKGMYDFEEAYIEERLFLVIRVKDKKLGPRQFKKHSRILEDKLEYPQIWYLRELHFHKVQRMIENGMNFVIEDKQIHLPSVNVSIRPERQAVRTDEQKLNGLAVNILIRQILKGDVSGKNKLEIANLFGTTQMTAGRAIETILANDLCEESKEGVSKLVHFRKRQDLWDYLAHEVPSPVKEVIFVDKEPKGLPITRISALSKNSMLADDEIPTFAISKKLFKKKYTKTFPVLEEFAMAKLELWDRPPMLTEDNCINVLDIYLTNKDDKDERVQIELEELLKKNKLEIG